MLFLEQFHAKNSSQEGICTKASQVCFIQLSCSCILSISFSASFSWRVTQSLSFKIGFLLINLNILSIFSIFSNAFSIYIFEVFHLSNTDFI
ncbi:MAG: hypothetical protein Q8S84_06730 [bacterium]|nr:hypothetical protein [bacterium]MDP3381154.1 hypothetical protein [bacterium]